MTGGRPPSGGARDDMAEPADPGLPDPALEALRDRAERLAGPSDAPIPEGSVTLSAEAVRQTLHELQVHQIELEMQNQELRRAQEELEASRTRYFDLFDLAPVGYLTLTEHGLIREANLASASLFGTSKSALLQQPLTRFIASEDQDIYYAARKRLAETGVPQVFELRMLRKNAAPFWAQVESVLAGEDPMAPVTRVVISDVTVLKQAEETLRLAQKLEAEANLIQIQRMESVGRLAGGVAHDFNNLLVVINGYCHLLLKELAATNPQRETIKEILAAGERATELTRQLLAYSRKQILHPQSFDLNQVVTGLQPMLARLVGEDVEVQLSLDTGISEVFADPHQMEQIVMNLIVNARRPDHDPHGRSGVERKCRAAAPRRGRGMLRHAGRERHWRRHERRNAAAYLRAVLHDQGNRPRHRAGIVDRPRHCEPERRLRGGPEPTGARGDVPGLPAGHPGATGGGCSAARSPRGHCRQ